MKSIIKILSVFILFSCAEKKTLELSLERKNGNGIFPIAFNAPRFYNEEESGLKKIIQSKVKGVPNSWTDIKYVDIETNLYQTIYQNYNQGSISQKMYQSLQKSYDWKPDTLILSKEPLRCRVAVAVGKTPTGQSQMIVDINNNLDFSDDVAFTPLLYKNRETNDSSISEQAMEITIDTYSNKKIRARKLPLYITYNSSLDRVFYNIPSHMSTKYKGIDIVVNSTLNSNSKFCKADIALLNNESNHIIKQGEYVDINNKIFKNLGIDRTQDVLTLEHIDLPKEEIQSTQIGYKLPPLIGADFKTKSNISLNDIKDKYVFLHFWSPKCRPCIEEAPDIAELYSTIDTSKIEFIGIVANTTEQGLKLFTEKHSIIYPQIISNRKSDIFKQYNLRGYPHSFLLNREGIIVAKNLRGKQLKDRISKINNNNAGR